MRTVHTALAVLGLVSAVPGLAQTTTDSAAIRRAALDYIEGWYEGNSDRMARAVHPELVKRIVLRDGAAAGELRGTGAGPLIEFTGRGGGSCIPADERRTDVTILDIYHGAASARVDAGGWIDYLHLARFAGGWKIVNVLWETSPSFTPRRCARERPRPDGHAGVPGL